MKLPHTQISLVLVALATVTAPAQAETANPSGARMLACPAPASGAGYTEPGELVRELYRLVSGPAGASKNWSRLRELHAPGAIITVPQHVEDRVEARTYNVDGFVALNDRLFAQRGFFETELRQESRQFGHVAHVWSAYASSEQPAGQPYAYGINSFQLLNDGTRWCLLSATWDGEAARHAAIRDWAGLPAAVKP